MELLDQAIAEVIGTFDDVEEISAGLREDIVIIFKGSIGYGKSLLVSNTHIDLGTGRHDCPFGASREHLV